MRRGTRVGQAYVAVTADGSGINEEIVDSVDAAGDDIEDSGDEHGRRYGDRFGDRFRDRLEGARERISDALGERLRQAGGSAGTEAGDAAGQSLGERLVEKTRDLGERIGSTLDDRVGWGIRRGLNQALSENDSTLDHLGDRLGERLGTHISESLGDRIEEMLARTLQDAEGMLDELVSRNPGRRPSAPSEDSDNSRSFATTLGNLFGSGSRNNALNLFGNLIGGVVRISEKMLSVFKGAPAIFNQFTQGMATASQGASFFQKVGAGLGKEGLDIGASFTSLAAAGPAAAVALTAVALAITLLVSVANALLAIVVALAATITSALVGALAVGAGALLAVGAAAGLATLAFTSMTDAQKALLIDAFQPLHAEAVGLGQVMLGQMVPAFAEWSRNLQVALGLAYPLAQVMGGALADAGRILTASLSGPGVQLLITALSTTLPGIVTHLSGALGGFINGMAGLFAALLPYVLQFSQYLEGVADRFATWATSASGQNAIVDFVGRALGALASLWNFVTAIGALLAEVLFNPSAQETGNNIFDRMADAVRRFTDYISKEDRLEKWFKQGLVFAIALGDAIKTMGQILQDLNESGVIDAIGSLASSAADAYGWFSNLPGALQAIIFPLKGIADLIGYIGSITGTDPSRPGSQVSSDLQGLLTNPGGSLGGTSNLFPTPGVTPYEAPDMSSLQAIIDQLQSSGNAALNQTSIEAGGYKPPPKPPTYVNPYEDFANSLIKSMPTIAQTIKKTMRELNKSVAQAINEAVLASGGDSVHDALLSQAESLRDQGDSLVSSAQDALSNSAQTLASATSKKAAKKALKEVRANQDELAEAQRAQGRLNDAADILSKQKILTGANVAALVSGITPFNATLADYAEARLQIADKLDAANQQLVTAIALRDNYQQQVASAANSFGSILGAQARTINGIQQALTANDITENLTERLNKLRAFQDGLRVLIARGLSDAAYRQLVDAGVEQGGAYVQALLNGGAGAIASTNSLVAQIDDVANSLGTEASSRLYQAGVDAAQGLVDGLTSLSAQLDSAAAALGESIAAAVKRSLGIASPSKVMDDMMDPVGDGGVNGLLRQRGKIGLAASKMFDEVAVSPSLAQAIADGRVPSKVSGNQDAGGNGDRRFRDLVVQTPTEDPIAVAYEVLNEVTGRLP